MLCLAKQSYDKQKPSKRIQTTQSKRQAKRSEARNKQTNKQTSKQTNKQTNKQTHKQTNKQTHKGMSTTKTVSGLPKCPKPPLQPRDTPQITKNNFSTHPPTPKP
jgi:hypothetical protein